MRGILGRWIVFRSQLKPYVNKLRYIWMSQSFDKAGKSGSIGRNVVFHGNLTIELDDCVTIRDGVQFGGNGFMRIGSRTCINAECILAATFSISIGDDVMLAPRVYVLDVDHSFDDRSRPIATQGYSVAPVVIEDDVWIGTGVVITKGVRIGKGSIIGANSVVTRDIPSYSIAAGIPARVIRERS